MGMRRTSFWTMVATLAGVIGAGASIYPLLNSEQQVVHLVLGKEIWRGSYDVYVHTLSEPVILTGEWTVRKKRGWWWESNVLDSTKHEGKFLFGDFKDRRVNAGSRTVLLASDRVDGFERCDVTEGELEFALQIKSKVGIAWARTTLPNCDRRTESGRREKPVVSDQTDYWKNIPLQPPAGDTNGKLDAEAISRTLNKGPPAR